MAIVQSATNTANTLFVFIDESGDLLPLNKGSEVLVISAFATEQPLEVTSRINKLRYELLQKGFGVSNFHAADDSRLIKTQFIQSLDGLEDCRAISIAFRKSPSSTTSDMKALYIKMLCQVTSELIYYTKTGALMVVLIDLTLDRNSRAAAKRKLKELFLSSNQRNYIYFQSMKRDVCGQVADYLAWSHFQNIGRRNDKYLTQMRKVLELKINELDDPLG